MQGFDPSTKSLKNLVEFCEIHEVTEYIFKKRDEGSYPTKTSNQSGESLQNVLLAGKEPYQTSKSSEEDVKTKSKNKINYKLSYPMYVPKHDIILRKVIQAQAKSMKPTLL